MCSLAFRIHAHLKWTSQINFTSPNFIQIVFSFVLLKSINSIVLTAYVLQIRKKYRIIIIAETCKVYLLCSWTIPDINPFYKERDS